MASAQLLKIAHGVDDKVKRVDAGVEDVDKKVNEVINGAQTVFISSSPIP
jgi:hypothetical protein